MTTVPGYLSKTLYSPIAPLRGARGQAPDPNRLGRGSIDPRPKYLDARPLGRPDSRAVPIASILATTQTRKPFRIFVRLARR